MDLSKKLKSLASDKEENQRKLIIYEHTIKELSDKNSKLNTETRELRIKSDGLSRETDLQKSEIDSQNKMLKKQELKLLEYKET